LPARIVPYLLPFADIVTLMYCPYQALSPDKRNISSCLRVDGRRREETFHRNADTCTNADGPSNLLLFPDSENNYALPSPKLLSRHFLHSPCETLVPPRLKPIMEPHQAQRMTITLNGLSTVARNLINLVCSWIGASPSWITSSACASRLWT